MTILGILASHSIYGSVAEIYRRQCFGGNVGTF